MEEEIKKMETAMEEMESEFNSMAFSAPDIFKVQMLINKQLLKIIKSLTGYSEKPKDKDWI